MQKSPNIKIFVSHHKPGYIYEDDIFVPIHVGKKNATIDLGILGDDTGDNISHKNPTYAELTAQYRVRKNYDLSNVDYVGFCHYRRYINYPIKATLKDIFFPFHDKRNLKNPAYLLSSLGNSIFFQKVCTRDFDIGLLETISRDIHNKIEGYDIILGKINHYFLNINKALNYDIYTIKIANFISNFLEKNYKEHFLAYKKCIKKYKGRNGCNIFIMKTKFFKEYSERLFDCLFKLEKEISRKKINYFDARHNDRFFGMMSERLLNAYVQIQEDNNIKIRKDGNLLFFK